MRVRGRQWTFAATAAFLAVSMAFLTSNGSAESGQPDGVTMPLGDCSSLIATSLDDVEITSAQIQPANEPVPDSRLPGFGPGMPPPQDQSGLPEFCRIKGNIRPESGSDIRFEAWLPSKGWDGRLNGSNSGGFAGYVNYTDLAGAVRAGQSGVATDTGHQASAVSGKWARGRPERIRDYGWRAVHLGTVAAKKLVARYYGRPAEKSYFIGCSNGGRQALVAASRFPDDYDGIVAGAPASVWTDLALSMINTVQAQSGPDARLRPEQAKILQSEVVRQCDSLDGLEDGLIADPRRCKPDYTALSCKTSKSAQCFSQGQLAALKRIHEGPSGLFGKARRLRISPFRSGSGKSGTVLRVGRLDHGNRRCARQPFDVPI